jgi:hypothetical protein
MPGRADSVSIGIPCCLRILVRDYFDEQRTVPFPCVLELLLCECDSIAIVRV